MKVFHRKLILLKDDNLNNVLRRKYLSDIIIYSNDINIEIHIFNRSQSVERILSFIIDVENDNKSISDYLKHLGYSRQIMIALKKQHEGIVVNGEWVYVTQHLHKGDHLILKLSDTESSPKIEPVQLPLNIVFEDEDILVINKGSDMPIHPSLNNYTNSLANSVMYYFHQKNMPFIFRCINRLDRDTSGLTIVAKNMFSACILSNQMNRREIHREYTAVVEGILVEKSGMITLPIGRKEGSTIERCIDFEHGEHAVTNYEVIYENASENYSIVKLILETGRTHQIRVHMAAIGHPLLGDFLYNQQANEKISRQALHAGRLDFVHPITGEKMQFTVPVPKDMGLFYGL